jgi:Lrp/AsnC family transcriptional regulator for asnA, asnC and gidA
VRLVGVPDPRAIGMNTHAVICMQVETQHIEAAEQQLVAMQELSFVYETAGPYDLIVVGFFPSVEELRTFLLTKVGSIPGIMRTDTFHIMRTVKRSYRYIRAGDSAGIAPRRSRHSQPSGTAKASRRAGQSPS